MEQARLPVSVAMHCSPDGAAVLNIMFSSANVEQSTLFALIHYLTIDRDNSLYDTYIPCKKSPKISQVVLLPLPIYRSEQSVYVDDGIASSRIDACGSTFCGLGSLRLVQSIWYLGKQHMLLDPFVPQAAARLILGPCRGKAMRITKVDVMTKCLARSRAEGVRHSIASRNTLVHEACGRQWGASIAAQVRLPC